MPSCQLFFLPPQLLLLPALVGQHAVNDLCAFEPIAVQDHPDGLHRNLEVVSLLDGALGRMVSERLVGLVVAVDDATYPQGAASCRINLQFKLFYFAEGPKVHQDVTFS